MKKCLLFFLWTFGVLLVSACDLEPKISSLPDSVGDFISVRYPALLADPETESEIYNSAVTDYGVYESPDLYGTNATNDYVNYANPSDYVLPPAEQKTVVEPEQPVAACDVPQPKATRDVSDEIPDDVLDIPERTVEKVSRAVKPEKTDKIIVNKGDTLYSLSRENNIAVKDLVAINGLVEPYVLHPGQELNLKPVKVAPKKDEPVRDLIVPERKVESGHKTNVPATKQQKVAPKPVSEQKVIVKKEPRVKTITIGAGDTLYSVSRRYAVPVNDLAIMNGLHAPFTLKNGQTLRVPDVPEVIIPRVTQQEPKEQKKTESVTKKTETKPVQKTVVKDVKKIEQKKPETKKVENKNTNADKSGVQKNQKSEPKKTTVNTRQQTPQKIAARSSSKFSWPLRGTILSHFGAKSGGLFNDGINIAAVSGAVVKSAENGVVAYAGNEIKGMGNLVIIQHAGGWMTVYAHLNSMSVRRGARVSVGDKIGLVGQTGKVTKPQLHFEIRKGTKAYNPVNYLKK